MAADHHHRDRRLLATDHVEQLQAVKLAALQPDIENDQRRPTLADRFDRLGAVVGAARRVPFVFENARDQSADVAFVVDDENVVAHIVFRLTLLTVRSCSADHCAAVACGEADAISFASRRNTRLMRAPPPSRSSRMRVPPWSSMIFLTIARPRPVPLLRVVM